MMLIWGQELISFNTSPVFIIHLKQSTEVYEYPSELGASSRNNYDVPQRDALKCGIH
jgi:hypothetical protein